MTREELNSLIYEITDVYDKLVCIVENCEHKEKAQIIHETMNHVYAELEKYKGAIKHLVESSHDVAPPKKLRMKEVADEKETKKNFGLNGRIYEAVLYE